MKQIVISLILLFGMNSARVARAAEFECDALQIVCVENQAIRKYLDCLEGKSRAIRFCSNRLAESLAGKRRQVLNMLDAKAKPVLDGLGQELAKSHSVLLRMEEINRDHTYDINQLTTRFSSFLSSYQNEIKPRLSTYESAQLEINAKLNETSKLAPSAKIDALLALRSAADTSYETTMRYVSQAQYSVALIRNDMKFFSSRYINETNPYRGYLAEHDMLDILFTVDQPLAMIEKIDVHLRDWIKVVTDQYTRNRQLMSSLIDAASEEKAKEIAGPIVIPYRDGSASANFLRKASAQIKEAFVDSAESSSSGMALMHRQYIAMKKFQEFAEVCTVSPLPLWMQSACKNVDVKSAAAARYLANLPQEITTNLDAIVEMGDPSLTSRIELVRGSVAARDLEAATAAYDDLMRGLKL